MKELTAPVLITRSQLFSVTKLCGNIWTDETVANTILILILKAVGGHAVNEAGSDPGCRARTQT